MKKILGFLTRNPIMGALAGALVTAVLQSSSATTVMVIGFVSAGLMSLPQAISVIFGANIGTTMTAQLMAFKISNYIYPIIFIGFMLNFVGKKEKVKNIESDFYDIILSFGFVLGGLIILAQLFLVFQFIRPFFIKRSRNSLSFITSIGSILWLGIAYTAGHAFFSTQLAPLLGVYWVISNHLYFNHDIQ